MEKPMRPIRINHRSGFTLIELLVVIAIIAILAAILFPVFAGAREKARQTACMSNMKQMGLAFVQYCQDFDEVSPYIVYSGTTNAPWGAPYFYGICPGAQLYPYVKSLAVFRCPSDSLVATTTVDSYLNANHDDPCSGCYGGVDNTSYGWNYYLMELSMEASYPTTDAGAIPTPVSKLQNPSSDAILFDTWGQKGGSLGWLLDSPNSFTIRITGSTGFTNVPVTGQSPLPGVIGHQNGANAVYADGHAKWYSTGYLMAQINAENACNSSYPNTGATRAFGLCSTLFHE